MKQRLFSLLALLLMAATGAVAQSYYTPTNDEEVIILNNVYDGDASASGYSSHAAVSWGANTDYSNKKAGDPNYNGAMTSSYVPCYTVKAQQAAKTITINITGVSKIVIYHASSNTNYVELRSGSKTGDLIGNGTTGTYYTEVALTETTNYSIVLHGTNNGSDDKDFYVYAIKLVKGSGSSTVPVTGVTLSQTEAAMTVGGEALTLTATIAPDNASDQTVTWTTSDTTVATVADGVVTAVGAGIATITATATNGTDETSDDMTATCTVTVSAPADIVIAPADITDGDITAAVAAAVADKTPRNIYIALDGTTTYTITAPIVAHESFVLQGNGATINASGLNDKFVKMTSRAETDSWKAIDSISFHNVTIKGLKSALFYSGYKNYDIHYLIIDNCIIERIKDSITLNFTKGSVARNVTIENSTIYAPTATTSIFYSSQSAQRASDITGFDSNVDKQTFTFRNSTLYNLAYGKNFFTHRHNNQKWLAYTAENNIFVNCGKSGQTIIGMNGGSLNSNPTWHITGNAFFFNGEDVSANESTGDNTEGEGVMNSVAGLINFTDAPNGDFNGLFQLAGAARPDTLGDPRWSIYGDVTGVTLSQTTLDMVAGNKTQLLTVTFVPVTVSNGTVTWTSSDPGVATVADGIVTAMGSGTALIIATATNGTADVSDDVSDTCTVTAAAPTIALAAGDEDAGRWTIEHTTFQPGSTIAATYNGSRKVKIVRAVRRVNPSDILGGEFTINSDGDKVRFSKGNLQATYNGTAWIWNFAAHQWDYVGGRTDGGTEAQTGNNYITGNGTASANGTVDLFGWSTSATYYGIHNSTSVGDYSGDFKDWGETMGSGWRTLSDNEWSYLMDWRDASTVNGVQDARYAKAKVNGVQGVILFPDTYTHPTSVTAPLGINSGGDTGWDGNNYSSTDWALMEAAGCVFLPAAGTRREANVTGVNTSGVYWSSNEDDLENGKSLSFARIGIAVYHDNKSTGLSIRLVRAAE